MNRKVLAALVLVAEILVAGYLALIAGLVSIWMVDDSQAFRMSDLDWVVEGGLRFGAVLLASVAFAVVARLAHRRWVVAADSPVWLRSVPILLGGCIALAGAGGATWFIVSKPFV